MSAAQFASGDAPGTTSSRAVLRWTAALGYFAAICDLHLQFSLWLVRPRELPWGRHAFAEAVPAMAAAGGALLLLVVIAQLWRARQRWPLASAWALWALAVLAIDRLLTFSANEHFHYPQYALLAWLLARALDPRRDRPAAGRVLFWTTLLGAVDELLQYLWITTAYSHYFDFNDVLMNLVAGAAGVMLYYGSGESLWKARRRSPWAEIAAAAIMSTAIVWALAAGRLQVSPAGEVPPGGLAQDERGRWALSLQRAPYWYGSWQQGPYRGQYYVLRPVEAMLALGCAGLLVAVLGRAGRKPQPAARDAATIPARSAAKST